MMSGRLAKSAVSTFLVGLAGGALVVGLVLPFAVDESGTSVRSAGGTGVDAGEPPEDGEVAGPGGTTGTGGEQTTGTGSGSGGTSSGGPSSGSGATPGSGGGAAGPSSGPRRASDIGVSADTIKVGTLVLDVATVGRMGIGVAIDPEQQCAAFQSFFNEINSRGGIHGRKIESRCESFDVTSPDDQIRACRALTQDFKAFAVLGGFNTVSTNLCITDENKTPLISNHNNFPDWVFERSGGRLITLYPRSGRMMRDAAAEFGRLGLYGKKFGILTDGLNDPQGHVMKQLEGFLEDRKQNVVYTGQLSDSIPTAGSQIPVEVQQARSAGTEVMVFLSSNSVYGTAFVRQAQEQGWRPTYVNTDWASNNGDSVNANMPESYEGAISITTGWNLAAKMQPEQEPPQAARCRQIYDEHSGRKLTPPKSGETNNEYGITTSFCDDVRIFERMATLAGPNLTRAGFIGAMGRIGGFEAANWGGGTFNATKTDYADLVRIQHWRFECKCWQRTEQGFHRPAA